MSARSGVLFTILEDVNTLMSALAAATTDSSALQEARTAGENAGYTPLSAVAADAVRLVMTTIHASTAVVVSQSAAVAAAVVAQGLQGKSTLTLINPHKEIVDSARELMRTEQPEHVLFRPIAGIPLDVMGRLAEKSYDVVLVEDMCDSIGLFVEASARLLRPGGVLILPNSLAGGDFLSHQDPADAVTQEEQDSVAACTLAGMLEESADFRIFRLPLDKGMTVAVRQG